MASETHHNIPYEPKKNCFILHKTTETYFNVVIEGYNDIENDLNKPEITLALFTNLVLVIAKMTVHYCHQRVVKGKPFL